MKLSKGKRLKPVLVFATQPVLVHFADSGSASVWFGVKSARKVAPWGVIAERHALDWTEDCSLVTGNAPPLTTRC